MITAAAAPAPRPGLRHALRAFQHRDFAIFWSGALASNTGTWVQNLAVPYVLYELTSSASWVGLAAFVQFAPSMLCGPVAGSMADRLDRRKVLMVTQASMAVAALVLWAAWVAGWREPVTILVLVGASGLLNGLNVPSWQSFVNDLVPRRDLLSAITLNSVQFNAARAIGPGIAGVVLATLGPTWAFLLNALSYAFVLAALAMVRTRPPVAVVTAGGGSVRQFARAGRYVRSQPGIVVGILVAVLVGFVANPIFQFTVVFAGEVYDVGALGLSALNVALGLGAVLAAPLVSGWDHVLARATVVRISLPGLGAAMVAFGLAPVHALGVVASLAVGAGFLALVSASNTSVQAIVADPMRGRVLGLRTVAFTGAYPLGALVQGFVSDVVGPRATVSGAGTCLLGAALWLRRRGELVDRLDDPHDERTDLDGEGAPWSGEAVRSGPEAP